MARDGQPKVREQGEEVVNVLPPQWNKEYIVGATLQGFYRGIKKINAKGGAPGETFDTYVIESEETGEIQSFSGRIAGRKMARIPVNTYVWITYTGMINVGRGKAHDYKIVPEKGVELLPEILE